MPRSQKTLNNSGPAVPDRKHLSNSKPNSSTPLISIKPSQPDNNQRDTDADAPDEEPQKPITLAEKQPLKREAEIAILIDSNRKLLQGGKLFSGRMLQSS